MSKYGRTYHLPFSPGTTSDDRISKDVSHLLNEECVITEKLDGENCGMNRKGVYARSHAAFTTSAWSKEVRNMHSWLSRDIPEGVFLFGENMEGVHSIEYERLTSYFYLFGVREEERWLSWDEVEEYAYLLGIPTAPVLFRGVIDSYEELKMRVEELVSQPSALGGNREGIVIRNTRAFHTSEFPRRVMKWVRKGHVTTSTHWTRDWKKAKLHF